MMKCRLCEKEFRSLQSSHIVPEWMYKGLYDQKNRFYLIRSDNKDKKKIVQLGFREKLLCNSCEGILCKWEAKTKKDFDDIATGRSNHLSINKESETLTYVERINHNSFKKCMLSILWRMSIAESDNFKIYDLGPYEDKIRLLLYEDKPLCTFEYPVMVQKIVFDGVYYRGIFMDRDKSKIGQGITMQSFIVYGFLIDIIISEKWSPEEENFYPLTDSGKMSLFNFDFKNLPQDPALLNRFRDPDVQNFYNQWRQYDKQ